MNPDDTDQNASDAFKRVVEIVKQDLGFDPSRSTGKNKRHIEQSIEKSIRQDRLKHFLEEGEYKVAMQNGTFICEKGYAFVNVVDKSPSYTIYRCDGGHHFAIVYTEFKEREGSSGNSRRIVKRGGEYVYEDDTERNDDQLELD